MCFYSYVTYNYSRTLSRLKERIPLNWQIRKLLVELVYCRSGRATREVGIFDEVVSEQEVRIQVGPPSYKRVRELSSNWHDPLIRRVVFVEGHTKRYHEEKRRYFVYFAESIVLTKVTCRYSSSC